MSVRTSGEFNLAEPLRRAGHRLDSPRVPGFVLAINERHLRRVLFSYVDYCHRSRTHLSLDKDCPDARPVGPPNCGEVIAIPQVGGLNQRYERLAA